MLPSGGATDCVAELTAGTEPPTCGADGPGESRIVPPANREPAARTQSGRSSLVAQGNALFAFTSRSSQSQPISCVGHTSAPPEKDGVTPRPFCLCGDDP